MTSYCDFEYLEKGIVKCDDFIPTKECGNGLHGLRAGDNYPGMWYGDDKFLVLEVDTDKIIDLDGKCKFPEAEVLFVADSMLELSAWLQKNNHFGAWYRGTATAGFKGTATAGHEGTATAGHEGVILIKDNNHHIYVGIVGKKGIKPDTPYNLINGKFTEITK